MVTFPSRIALNLIIGEPILAFLVAANQVPLELRHFKNIGVPV